MSFENPQLAQGPERTRTPEQREKEVKSKMFKGLLAVGVGAWWAYMRRLEAIDPLSSGPSEKNRELIKEKGFLGAAGEKIKNTYTNLEKAEKFLDPEGEVGLLDWFERVFPDKKEEQAQENVSETQETT